MSKFKPPTPGEVCVDMHIYSRSKKYEFNKTEISAMAEDFMDFYGCKGWKVGKSPMVNWPLAAKRWVRNNWKKIADSTANNFNRDPDGKTFAERYKENNEKDQTSRGR